MSPDDTMNTTDRASALRVSPWMTSYEANEPANAHGAVAEKNSLSLNSDPPATFRGLTKTLPWSIRGLQVNDLRLASTACLLT